jgi:hypothetical protein
MIKESCVIRLIAYREYLSTTYWKNHAKLMSGYTVTHRDEPMPLPKLDQPNENGQARVRPKSGLDPLMCTATVKQR